MPKEFYGESSHDSYKHMYNKDHANMPKDVVMSDYPKDFSAVPYKLYDSAYGLDKQASYNHMKVAKDMYKPYGK